LGELKILKTDLKVKKKTSMITNSKQGYLTKSLVVDFRKISLPFKLPPKTKAEPFKNLTLLFPYGL
jgi:hypothetical protein